MAKARSPFDYITAIQRTGADLMIDGDQSGYVPFIINRGLSRDRAYLNTVQFLNVFPNLWHDAQFAYLLNTTPRTHKYHKWLKADKPDPAIKDFAERFNLGLRDAADYWNMLDDDTKSEIARD